MAKAGDRRSQEREVTVRESGPEDAAHAEAAARMIDAVADEFDIARRAPEWLASKIRARRAALALDAKGRLVGFGYWSSWEDDRFVSHSGLVVDPVHKGQGLGRRLKTVLFESTRRQLPRAAIMSLTTSPQVLRMNASLGFREVPFERMTKDESFWDGCKTCRNYAAVRARGERCCCQAMLWDPADHEEHAAPGEARPSTDAER